MRIRNRIVPNDPHVHPGTSNPHEGIACGGAPFTVNPGFISGATTQCDLVSEMMLDSTDRQRNKSVLHRRKQRITNKDTGPDNVYAGLSPLGVMTIAGDGGRNVAINAGLLDTVDGFETVNPLLPLTPPVRYSITPLTSTQEDSLKEDCFEKARGLKADVLLNAIEANQMWPAVRSLATALPEMAYQWGKIRKVLTTASGAYLAWKFGVSPILSDIESIQKYLPSMGKDIARHVKGDVYRYSAVKPCALTFDSTLQIAGTYYVRTYKSKVIKSPETRYVLLVKPTSNRYHTDFFKKLDATVGRFASSPASLAWELIPFSFVVDWFVDLRGALRALDNMVGFEPYEVLGFSRSHSYKVQTAVKQGVQSPCDGSYVYECDCGTYEFSHYERTPVSTAPSGINWKPRFGKNQAGLSAALITQQLSKLRAK